MLQSHCNGISIYTTHKQTKQTSYSEELLERSRVDGCDLKETQDNHVSNHGPLSSESVSKETEERSTDGPEKQSKGDGR